jgi:hypothetical protein
VIVAAEVAELVVQGVVGLIAALIGAGATLYATRQAASGALTTALEIDRAEHHAEQRHGRHVALTGLVTELRLNSKVLPESHVWHAHLQLPRSALEHALPVGLEDRSAVEPEVGDGLPYRGETVASVQGP